MFPDMYLQYNHPTSKSQQKPFDKNRQNLIPLHPPQRRFHTPPHNADSTLTPQRIQRSADAPPPPGKPQGNSAPAAIQRSADGSPTPVRPPRPHTPQKTERTDCQRDGCLSVRPSIHPTKKEPPGPNTQELSQNSNIQLSSIVISYYQLSPTITQHAAETSESPSHWKPSQSQPQDS